MTLGPPRRCRCGNLVDKGGVTCGLAICICDPDETEGRALYRARADALAKAQVSIGKRRVTMERIEGERG